MILIKNSVLDKNSDLETLLLTKKGVLRKEVFNLIILYNDSAMFQAHSTSSEVNRYLIISTESRSYRYLLS